jgi:hypothetical protein
MRQTKNSSPVLVLVTLLLFVFLFVFFLYTFLHEGGHALAGWLYGQSLTEFDVSFWNFSAHVEMAGGELTRPQLAVQSMAGASLPLLIWAIFISIVPRKARFTLESLKVISSMAVVNTLLVWVVLPWLFLIGKAPSDDVTNFLRHSQMPPILLSIIALLLYIAGWMLFLTKMEGLRKAFLLFTTTDREIITAGMRKTVISMGSIMLACILLTLILNVSVADHSLNRFSPPPDFEPVAQIDLSSQTFSSETLTQFTLEEPSHVGVFVIIRNVDTTYFDLSITGADGFNSVVLHGEGYSAHEDGGLWEQDLPPGKYRLVLTSHQSQGTLSVFLNTH